MSAAESNDRGSFEPHVACNCQRCADLHGDQAEDSSQREVYRLQAETTRLNYVIEAMTGTITALDRSRNEYRKEFVGKVEELKKFQATIDDAVSEKVDAEVSDEARELRRRFVAGMKAVGQEIVSGDVLERVHKNEIAMEEFEAHLRTARLLERERCAELADDYACPQCDAGAVGLVVAIRALR